MASYVQPRPRGLFDTSERLEELHALGDPLARLDQIIDWTRFLPVLERLPRCQPKGPGGRPAYPPLMMFKALVMQSLYSLSDAQLQFQIIDRLSFKRFLGLTEADSAPDEKTFWAFRNTLSCHRLVEPLFTTFHQALEAKGLFARQGQIIDATFVEVPRQRNARRENAQLKAGQVPEEWDANPHMLRQKDLDARWTQKNGENYYGYKNHVKVDSRSKLIECFTVTHAAVHDSQALSVLVQKGDPVTYVDSAYTGQACEAIFGGLGVKAKPIERAYRNRPLNGRQRRSNRARSRLRVRVEHVFATMKMSLRATWNRCVGKRRNQAAIGLLNLVYNMVRYEQIERLGLRHWRAA